MKKFVSLILAILVMFSLCACGAENNETEVKEPDPVSDVSEPSVTEDEVAEKSIADLSQGDKVSIVGQVASSGLVNENTLWVQVQQLDGSFVIYHCQMKQEMIETATGYKMLDVVKVTGSVLSVMDLEQENTSPLVTLHDCEIEE